MRTRTLLLLAVACGLAILVAGGIQLLRITGEGTPDDDLAVGDRGQAGDLVVTVLDAHLADGTMRVDVEWGGVDDPDALDGFWLVVEGRGEALAPVTSADAGTGACAAATVEPQQCAIVFATGDSEGDMLLLLRRGEDRRRWALT